MSEVTRRSLLRLVRGVESGLVGGTKLIDGGVNLSYRGLRVGTDFVGLADFLVQSVNDSLILLANDVLVAPDADLVDRLAQRLLIGDSRSVILAEIGVGGNLVDTILESLALAISRPSPT